MFGLFFLALFFRFATAPGAIMGAVYGLTAGVVVGFWDVVTGLPKISFQWIGPTALLVSLTAGGLFSLLTAKNRTPFMAWLWGGTGIAALGLIVARLVALRS
jgi:Na+/proline symporter